jgi:hypothetical protein
MLARRNARGPSTYRNELQAQLTNSEVREEKQMTMPGFTAEASLNTSQRYALNPSQPRLAAGVVPQICVIDQDATAATGHTVYRCIIRIDGIDIIPPREVLQ